MVNLESFDVLTDVRGNYKSVDVHLAPKGEKYADLVEKVFEVFEEESFELVIDESSMPLPYYQALEIPLDVFKEKYEIDDEKTVSKDKALNLCRELMSLGFFDIGFKGEKISVIISHNGYINVQPTGLDKVKFEKKVEEIGVVDDK